MMVAATRWVFIVVSAYDPTHIIPAHVVVSPDHLDPRHLAGISSAVHRDQSVLFFNWNRVALVPVGSFFI